MTPGHAPSMAAAQFHHHHHHHHNNNNNSPSTHKRGAPQQSNSVPSTPLQHPRDLRFHSRSPSPSKASGHHSPHSAASEAVGTPTVPRITQPQFCKFETGAEYRKRRIIYTEGGNEPLPPPKDAPKAALEPGEDGTLSADMTALYHRLLPSDESEERRAKLVQKLEDILNGEWPGSEIRVNVFGSSGNLLSSSDSDVDVCVTTPLKKLESMHTLAAVLHKHGMDKVVCRASAKVPIVKIWDPDLQLACDLNVNNPLALENTRMIKTYVQIDDRVRPLAKIIKFWTKQRILNDAAFGGTISSYTWICMIINFLQVRDPPILPSLQKMPCKRSTKANGQPSSFADDLDELRGYGEANKETLGQLLFHFFRHYGYVFDYADFVVSVKEGRLLPRKEKGWDSTNYMDKEARSRLCVEEPFNTLRNLGNSADDYAFTGIHNEIRRAFDLIKDGSKLDACCEQYEFPPEEKPIFQRPTPKPKPVLTRSASQSGRPNSGSQPGRGNANGNRNNRNSSNQRNNNRRSSSGTTHGGQRLPYVMSPPVGINPSDYFSTTGMSTDQLHNQLYKQYQFLQAQQEALRNQLLQQQQQTQAAQLQQVQARGVDMGSSPRSRQFATNVPSPHSPRTFENPSTTAPLLPGYLYHYPARYPPPSPLSQSRNTEDPVTGPSSPSLSNATPSLRRAVHRGSVTEGTASASARSQSQPGRSFPNPLTLQGLVHPGYDVSGAIAAPYSTPRSVQQFPHVPANGSVRLANGAFPTESAMPKEYVGYYVGQSPQLLAQYQAGNITHVTQLRDAPQQTVRRVSPELVPPIAPNGLRHQSRSPSPLGDGRRRKSSSVSAMQVPRVPQAPQALSQHAPQPAPPLPSKVVESQGPVIVNGSNLAAASRPRQLSSAAAIPHPSGLEVTPDMIPTEHIQQMSLDGSLAHANGLAQPFDFGNTASSHFGGLSNGHTAEAASIHDVAVPVWRPIADAHDVSLPTAEPVPSAAKYQVPQTRGLPRQNNGDSTCAEPPSLKDLPQPSTGLSPVVEKRTPSPTASAAKPAAPHHKLAQNVQIANGKAMEAHGITSVPKSKHSGSNNADRGEGKHQGSLGNVAGNSWQQAPGRKGGHKKSKSIAGRGPNPVKAGGGGGGEPLPANEADRKGG